MDFDALRSRALEGKVQDQYCLAVAYENGLGVVQDYHKALFWYRKIAEADGSDVESELAWAYDFKACDFDRIRSVLCRKAADKRVLESLKSRDKRAEMLSTGTPEDPLVVFWYEMAAEQGDMDAQYSMAKFYEGIRPKNRAKSFFWFKQAALQGDASSQSSLGLYFSKGYGCERSREQAMYWYEQSAMKGDWCGQSFLAEKYRRLGKFHEEDARYWFLKLAEQGDVDAQATLAEMFITGEGGPVDLAEAYAWYATCAAGPFDGFAKKCNAVASKLTPEQKVRAKKLAADYIAKYLMEE